MTLRHSLLAGVAMTAAERAQGRFMRAPDGHPEGGDPPAPPAPASFDDAFAAAAAEDETPPADDNAAPAPPAQPEGGEPPAAPTPPAQPDGQQAPPADGQQPPADGQQPPADGQQPPAPPAAPTADDIVKGLAEALKQQPPQQQQAPAAPQQEEQPQPLYTEAEQAAITEYEKNWPDVAAAETLKRRAEYHDLIKFVFGQVSQMVAPMQEQLRTVGNTLHTQELTQAVPDYSEKLEADVAAWVETQPAYLQGPYKQVMQTGTSEEVADLIGRYRQATGTQAPPAQAPSGQQPAPPAPPAQPAKTELSEVAKQAVASLAPVGSDRTAVPQGEDQGDFDSAFARYAKEAAG